MGKAPPETGEHLPFWLSLSTVETPTGYSLALVIDDWSFELPLLMIHAGDHNALLFVVSTSHIGEIPSQSPVDDDFNYVFT